MKTDTCETGAPGPAPDSPVRAQWAHIIPFVAWLFAMQMLGDAAGWKYAVRSVVCAGLFLWLRPWAGYPALKVRNLPLAFAAGVAVYGAWVGLQTAWFGGRFPAIQEFYLRYAVLPWGRFPEPLTSFPYAPEVCGWPLALARLAGSAFVIAVIEEFFWRGWLYRWMLGKDFRAVDPGRFDLWPFLLTAVVFAVEHNEWLAGLFAGLVYGWLYLKTRDIWATAVAHIITNFILGWHVLATGAYHFW